LEKKNKFVSQIQMHSLVTVIKLSIFMNIFVVMANVMITDRT